MIAVAAFSLAAAYLIVGPLIGITCRNQALALPVMHLSIPIAWFCAVVGLWAVGM